MAVKTLRALPLSRHSSIQVFKNQINLRILPNRTPEHIIYSSVFSHLERHNLLSDSQHGFRARRSCETQLLGAINDFQLCLNSGGHIDALFLDFAKAFDKLDTVKQNNNKNNKKKVYGTPNATKIRQIFFLFDIDILASIKSITSMFLHRYFQIDFTKKHR